MHESEPLLELFTKAHPWVVGTINGSLHAYTTTKHYSPQIVRYGANVIERSIGTPMVNTVSSVGRMTGVESGLRWYYGGSPQLKHEYQHASDEMDIKYGPLSPDATHRRDSAASRDTLPSYHASKPPSYREGISPVRTRQAGPGTGGPHSRSFSNQVIVMTSGLSVALSVSSRKSLRFCLHFLESAAQHTSTVANALSLVLQQYDEARDSWHRTQDVSMKMEGGERNESSDQTDDARRVHTPELDEASRRLAGIIKTHSDDIWNTLQAVVASISNYAGGALPENARAFVRNQLMSLPQRWQWVSEKHPSGSTIGVSHDASTAESETSRRAHRMIAFATEGLDMMSQVGETVRLTLESAERWLERVGRRAEGDLEAGSVREQEKGETMDVEGVAENDCEMQDVDEAR